MASDRPVRNHSGTVVKHLLLSLALAGCAVAERPVVFANATLASAASNPEYWRRPIEVCGHVLAQRGPNVEWTLERVTPGGTAWLLVDVRAGPLQPGSEVCVRGVVRRPDGLTDAQAMARGSYRPVADAVNSNYVLYPCSDAASCRRVLRGRFPQ